MGHNAFLAILAPHETFFLLRTYHKPLGWLTIVSNVYGHRGLWIFMLQDFHFKIIHRAKVEHANVDALSRNPIGRYEVDEDFGGEIKDLDGIAQGVSMFPIGKGNETIDNLFTMMEKDVTPYHTKGQVHKGKKSLCIRMKNNIKG
jgi:hypothetical protein